VSGRLWKEGADDDGDLHEVEFMIETSPGLSDGSGVAQHADSALDLRQVASRDDSGWLVVDANLEASGTPVHELDGPKRCKIRVSIFSLGP
jgi:hypothetical protein